MQQKYRLKSSRAFEFIYKKGVSVSDRNIVLLWIKSRDGGIRAGFTVSRKIGGSVTRNKIRRRMKEAFRALIPGINNGYTYVLLARPPIADADYRSIRQSIIKLLIKAGHISEDILT